MRGCLHQGAADDQRTVEIAHFGDGMQDRPLSPAVIENPIDAAAIHVPLPNTAHLCAGKLLEGDAARQRAVAIAPCCSRTR